jgi:hypothetical protein
MTLSIQPTFDSPAPIPAHANKTNFQPIPYTIGSIHTMPLEDRAGKETWSDGRA